MEIDVREFALRKKVSQRRVLQLIERGDLKARRLSSQWLIDAAELGRKPNLSRPMSLKMSKAMLKLISNQEPFEELDPTEKSRLQRYMRGLKAHEDPALLLKSWLRRRAQARGYSINLKDMHGLRRDLGVIPSGVSDPRSGLSSQDFFEGYVLKGDLKRIERKYLLVKSDHPNVILRLLEFELPRPIPVGYVIADLAEHEGAREQSRVKKMISLI
jgi:hypothetical protein